MTKRPASDELEQFEAAQRETEAMLAADLSEVRRIPSLPDSRCARPAGAAPDRLARTKATRFPAALWVRGAGAGRLGGVLCRYGAKTKNPAHGRASRGIRKSLILRMILVGETGFEPATPRSQTACATGLRHSP